MRLAGTYHPIPYLLEKIKLYLPGIEEVNALWIDFDKQLYSTNDDDLPIKGSLKIKAQNIRNVKTITEWRQSNHLFENTKPQKKQLTLEDEDALNVLSIYFYSPLDNLKDIILISFPENLFLKGLNITFKGISSQEKLILSNLLSSILITEYEKAFKERKFLLQIENNNQRQENKIQELIKNLKSTEQLYSSAINSIVNEFKLQFENKLRKTLIFPEKTMQILAKEYLTVKQIEKIVQDAIYLAYNLNFSKSSITIKSNYIQLGDLRKPLTTAAKPKIESNDKVKILLNKYEDAAIKVEKNGRVLNAQNIAAHLSPPVTPPAITDAVRRNKTKIAYLLQQYPEKWLKIREAIRPIEQLQQKNYASNAM